MVRHRVHAGRRALCRVPVGKRIGWCICLSGIVSSVAAIIIRFAPRTGQADAGTGYEVDAITAVVLGGTSVFGGRGTLWGTLLRLVFDFDIAERLAPGRAALRNSRAY